jgi:uncharacterized protein YxjI
MKLYIKQKVFSWSDKFVIKDETGADKYHVEGELFSWGHKLHLFDMNDQEAAFIKQKILTFLPKFEVYIQENLAFEVVKEFTLFKPKYTMVGLDWVVDGDFWSHSYTITGNSGIIASISKVWFSWGDSYELDIADGADEVSVVAAVLAIDCVLDAQHNSSSSMNH